MSVGEDAFSPQSQNALKLWADLHLSDKDVDDKFTDDEGTRQASDSSASARETFPP